MVPGEGNKANLSIINFGGASVENEDRIPYIMENGKDEKIWNGECALDFNLLFYHIYMDNIP